MPHPHARAGAQPALVSCVSRIPADGHAPTRAGSSPTAAKRVLAEPTDANEPGDGVYRTIGEPLNPDQEALPGQEPVSIGKVFDADDPDAGPPDERDGDPVHLGDPVDADVSMEETSDVPAEPERIGEALDADEPD